jgi:cell division septum initiation protein DivIVA
MIIIIIVENSKSYDRFINGLQNEGDLNAFLELVENTDSNIRYLDCLLNTTNKDVLARLEILIKRGKEETDANSSFIVLPSSRIAKNFQRQLEEN